MNEINDNDIAAMSGVDSSANLDAFPCAKIVLSGRNIMKPKIEFVLGTPWVNQAECDGVTTLYVYRDGTCEIGECSKDGQVHAAIQIGATYLSNGTNTLFRRNPMKKNTQL